MAATALETEEQITGEVNLFGGIMQQNCLLNEFNRIFAPLASIAENALIEFLVKGADQLYLDLNDSRFHLRVKMTKADGTNMTAATGAIINLPLHSLFREMSVELNGRSVSDPNQMYPYLAYLETLLNSSKETQETRLLTEGWVRDSQPAGCDGRERRQQRSGHTRHHVRPEQDGRARRSPSRGRVST